MSHRVEYKNANDAYCHDCGKIIPNAHARYHAENGPIDG